MSPRVDRRLPFLAAGVAVPTLLLAVGWFATSVRENRALERAQRADLEHAVERVRLAVDESLGALERAEGRRPFYLYNHFYSPPEVLSLNDTVAVTPLAEAPSDPRVLGYFQVDPRGAVGTPYVAPGARPTPRAARVVAIVSSPAFASVRDLAGFDEGGRPRESPSPAAGAAKKPVGPLTETLAPLSQEVAEDIEAAQAGDPVAQARLAAPIRRIPKTMRNVVEWPAYSQSANRQVAVQPAKEPEPGAQRPTDGAPDPRPDPTRLPPRAQRSAEVNYTSMAWRPVGEHLILYRVVTHLGASAVQGVLLDRVYLTETWLPRFVAERTSDLRLATRAHDCALSRPASAILRAPLLCVPEVALPRAGTLLANVSVELALLLGLLGIVGLALVAVFRAARSAQALARQRGDFVSAVSHELRTPLTTLRMHAEMLAEGLVSDARRDRVHTQLAEESARLARIVNNVLELSRADQGKRALQRHAGDLRAHVSAIVEEQRPRVEARGFSLAGPAAGSPVHAVFDASGVEQIVTNLLDNALKYGAGDPCALEVSVTLEDGRATLVVADRGPGVPEAEQRRVFDRFHRVATAGAAHAPGTGLGLALVRELARAHGGDATLESRPGGGAEVRVWLGEPG